MPRYTPRKRLSLIEPDKHFRNMGKTSRFIDDVTKFIIDFSGFPMYVYRYIGVPKEPDAAIVNISEFMGDGGIFEIGDAVLNENRDRKYDIENVPMVRGTMIESTNDLELLAIGFRSNDQITIQFHTNDILRALGRKIIVGDVIEIPTRRETMLDGRVSNKWYEVIDVTMDVSIGNDAFGIYHFTGAVCKPIMDQQEFIQILEQVRDEYGNSVRDNLSNRGKMDTLTAANESEAIDKVHTTNFDMTYVWYRSDPDRLPDKYQSSELPPEHNDLAPVPEGHDFPGNPAEREWFYRTDLVPGRLYQFKDGKWRLRGINHKREWKYNWTRFQNRFLSKDETGNIGKNAERKSISDVLTERHETSDPVRDEE